MSTAVKYFSSEFTGAPTLNGTAGSLISILDACLVDGYDLRTVNSLTVSSNVATATVSAGHPYPVGGVVLIEGATPAELNGEKRVLSATANTFTYAAPGVADGSASGTISSKMAPAGWTKAFSGTNKAAYRFAGMNGMFLRVDESGDATFALVRGFRDMTDVDTGSQPFPQPGQMASGLWWKKSNQANSTAREWRLVADDRMLHFFCLWHLGAAYRGGGWYTFGKVTSYLADDQTDVLITGYFANPANNYNSNHFLRASYDHQGKYLAGDMAQMIESVRAGNMFIQTVSDDTSTMACRFGPNYPGAIDGGLHVFGPLLLHEWSGSISGYDTTQRLRGTVPGVYQTLHNSIMPGTYSMVSGVSGLDGRSILLAPIAYPSSSDHGTSVAVDITGPWR